MTARITSPSPVLADRCARRLARRCCAGALGLGLVTAATGCGMELPLVQVIDSRRPLAVRVEVTGPLMPEDPELAPRAQALPFEEVTVTPFVVDVDGPVPPDQLGGVWFACPLGPTGGAFDCISDRFPIDPTDVPDCEPPPGMMDLDFDDLPEAQDLCRIGTDGEFQYTVPLDNNILAGGRIELTLVAGVPDGTSTDACVEQLLSGDFDLPKDCILVNQVITVGPLERLFLLAEQFGVDIPAGFEVPDPDEIPDFDRHPRIALFQASVVPESLSTDRRDREDIPLGGTYGAASPLEIVRVDTSTPEEDLQTFNITSSDGSTREQMEFLEGSWFVDFGRLLSSSSNDPSSFNEIELRKNRQGEDDTPEDGRLRVYYVLRDGRAGVSWWWFEIELQP